MVDKLNNLEQELKLMGISPAELARRSHVSAPTISRIINEPDYNPGIEIVDKIKRCLLHEQVEVSQTLIQKTLNNQIDELKADKKRLQNQLDELIKKL